MQADDIARHLLETFPGIGTDTTTPDTFFYAGEDRRLPFATLVTRDNDYDNASRLDRPGTFRLNLGIGRETFRALIDDGQPHDLTTLDVVMPHPTYGKMFWICVVNPGPETFERLKPLMVEAHALAARREARLAERPGGEG
jgi:hypothetical protein